MRELMYNEKTDVWSFGVVIYEILTRKVPYTEMESTMAAVKVMEGSVSLVPEIEANKDDYPSILVTLIHLCLQYDPKARPSFRDIVRMFD